MFGFHCLHGSTTLQFHRGSSCYGFVCNLFAHFRISRAIRFFKHNEPFEASARSLEHHTVMSKNTRSRNDIHNMNRGYLKKQLHITAASGTPLILNYQKQLSGSTSALNHNFRRIYNDAAQSEPEKLVHAPIRGEPPPHT
jgi:hypothetical protein